MFTNPNPSQGQNPRTLAEAKLWFTNPNPSQGQNPRTLIEEEPWFTTNWGPMV